MDKAPGSNSLWERFIAWLMGLFGRRPDMPGAGASNDWSSYARAGERSGDDESPGAAVSHVVDDAADDGSSGWNRIRGAFDGEDEANRAPGLATAASGSDEMAPSSVSDAQSSVGWDRVRGMLGDDADAAGGAANGAATSGSAAGEAHEATDNVGAGDPGVEHGAEGFGNASSTISAKEYSANRSTDTGLSIDLAPATEAFTPGSSAGGADSGETPGEIAHPEAPLFQTEAFEHPEGVDVEAETWERETESRVDEVAGATEAGPVQAASWGDSVETGWQDASSEPNVATSEVEGAAGAGAATFASSAPDMSSGAAGIDVADLVREGSAEAAGDDSAWSASSEAVGESVGIAYEPDSTATPSQTWDESADAAAAEDVLVSEEHQSDAAAVGVVAAAGGATVAGAGKDVGTEDLVPRGAVRGDGSRNCPDGYPLKGNASSQIYHMPGQSSYDATEPEFCFGTEEDAVAAGYRPRKGGGRSIGSDAADDTLDGDVEANAAKSISAEQPAVDRPSMATVAPANDTMEPVAGAGSVKADEGGQCPPAYPIKGNASSKIFHVPDQSSYRGTKAEFCFASEDDAVSAGYRPRGGVRPAATSSSEAGGDSAPEADETPKSDQTVNEISYGLRAPEPAAAMAKAELAEPTAVERSGIRAADAKSASNIPSGAVAGNGTRECPSGYPIKGNGSSLIFHVPTGSSYDVTEPEYCFASEEDALAAGYRASKR